MLSALILALTVGILSCSAMKEMPADGAARMSLDELKSKLSDSNVVIIDVRTGKDWEQSKQKIKGAIREDPKGDVAAWSAKYPKDKTFVLYCA
jgi:rhodanese-related sulfurtransferase